MKKILIAGIEDRVPHYIATLRAVGLEPVVGLGVDDIAPFAGLLLPGGGDVDPALFGQENHGSRQIERDLDDAQLSLLHRFADAGKPVLGICKGCQVLNVGLGGDMIQDLPNSVDHAFDEDFQFHDITCAPGSLLDRLYGPTVRVNSAHHQAVDRLGKGLRATAVSPDGVTEALEHETLPLYGFQFHPERMCFANLRPEAVDGAPIFEFFKTLVEEQP